MSRKRKTEIVKEEENNKLDNEEDNSINKYFLILNKEIKVNENIRKIYGEKLL